MRIHEKLRQLGIDPKKSLGQNFMVEQNALLRLAEAAGIGPDDAVLEIGAGLGALTDILAEQARRVVAIEIDERFTGFLRAQYGDMAHVEVVEADVLEVDIPALMGDDADDYKVVANLPYYITSPILRTLLESSAPPSLMVLTMQREVGERLTADPGDMNLLAIGVQFYGEPEVVTRLSAANFYPRPNVESVIVRVAPHVEGAPLPREEREGFFRMVRAGFSQPRKQVKNCLSAGLHLSSDAVVAWMKEAGIDPRRRAETIALEEWVRLYEAGIPL